MRPGHIKVFDGLRVTTEHVDHLQGAMHSALQEIREILGLGRVYFGFEVSAEDSVDIIVQPGLAFDYQGNRLTSEESKTVKVSFEPGEESKFVCLKYDQVEDGQVEDHFTMVWDSCSVILRAGRPEPKENLLPIAQVIKPTGEDEALEVISLPSRERNKEAEGDIPKITMPWRLQGRQGVVRIATDDGKNGYLSGMLLEPLKKKLSEGGAGNEGELVFTLGEKEVALDLSISSFSSQTIITANLSFTEDVTEGGEQYTNLKFQSTARGEATCAGEAISQFGVSTIQAYPGAESSWTSWMVSELTERGIAHLPFHTLSKDKVSETAETSWGVLQRLQLLIRVEKTSGPGFKIICNLLWKGGVSKEVIQLLQTKKLDFSWETLVGWKVLGDLP